jgi:hypothetical protein
VHVAVHQGLQRLPGTVELLDLLDTLGQLPYHGSQGTPPLGTGPAQKHRVDQTLTPDIQAREGVGGTMCVPPRRAGEPSTVTRDGAFLEDQPLPSGSLKDWRLGLTVGRPGRVIRCCTPNLVVANRVQGPVGRWRRLPSRLRALPAVLGRERAAGLADQARVRFHAAA